MTETGVWCDHCLLPSAVAVDADLVGVIQGRDVPVGTARIVVCPDCGHRSTRMEAA